MNTSQIMNQWQSYFNNPGGAQLGLIVAMLDIGSIASFWMIPFFADNYGRKMPILIGNVIEITGALLSAFANGKGSEYFQPLAEKITPYEYVTDQCSSELFKSVHGRPIHLRLRRILCWRFSPLDHGNFPSAASRQSICNPQLHVRRRIQLLLLDCAGGRSHPGRLVMALPNIPAVSAVTLCSLPHILDPRVATLSHLSGKVRDRRDDAGKIPRERG